MSLEPVALCCGLLHFRVMQLATQQSKTEARTFQGCVVRPKGTQPWLLASGTAREVCPPPNGSSMGALTVATDSRDLRDLRGGWGMKGASRVSMNSQTVLFFIPSTFHIGLSGPLGHPPCSLKRRSSSRRPRASPGSGLARFLGARFPTSSPLGGVFCSCYFEARST